MNQWTEQSIAQCVHREKDIPRLEAVQSSLWCQSGAYLWLFVLMWVQDPYWMLGIQSDHVCKWSFPSVLLIWVQRTIPNEVHCILNCSLVPDINPHCLPNNFPINCPVKLHLPCAGKNWGDPRGKTCKAHNYFWWTQSHPSSIDSSPIFVGILCYVKSTTHKLYLPSRLLIWLNKPWKTPTYDKFGNLLSL